MWGIEERHIIRSMDGTEYDLEELIRSYGTDVLRTTYLYVKDKAAAEDIFQEIFLKVSQNIADFQGKSSIKTWILRITINLCKDYLKSAYQKRVVPMMEFTEESLEAEDQYEEVEKRETEKTVKEAVSKLPEYYKDVVICIYYQEMSVKETANALKIAEGTVKSRLKRARERLRKSLEGRL